MRKRAFICDPVCALPYGHNVVGLKYFSDSVRAMFESVIPVASSALPAHIANKYDFEREFSFYYQDHIKIDSAKSLIKPIPQKSDDFMDPVLALAVTEFKALIAKFSVNKDDAIIFPCADYYGVMGVIHALRESRPEDSPKVFVRFIGVMENATAIKLPGLPPLLRSLSKAIQEGYQFSLCAETPRYADVLASELNAFVAVVPYPANAHPPEQTVFTEGDTFNVICPGSARLDKGYLLLADIFTAIRRMDPKLTIRFVTQGLPIAEAVNHVSYTNGLYAVPGVKLLGSSISEQEMNALYATANLVLLPYDSQTYHLRGSAVFMESILRGIPVVALSGSAFCEQITYYGAGTLVSDVGSLSQSILTQRKNKISVIQQRMRQARHRFSIDSSAALEHWVAA